jgi:thiamine biosynthesis lipoprotein
MLWKKSKPRQKFNATFEAIGTRWEIDATAPIDQQTFETILTAVQQRIAEFDHVYSRFKLDSVVTKMSQEAGTYLLPPDAEPLFKLYRKLYDLTAGAFTPFIGDLLTAAGYDREYSLISKKLPTVKDWSAIAFTPPELEIKTPVLLDFGAAGKGYLIDLVAAVLKKHTVTDFTIDAGGDILHQSDERKPLRVGLEHPENLSQAIGVVTLSEGSICGSAGNRRNWGTFHHTINPHTQSSPKHILATWVTAETAFLADALATCLYFVEPATLEAEFDFEYLLLDPTYQVKKSANFPAELFYQST